MLSFIFCARSEIKPISRGTRGADFTGALRENEQQAVPLFFHLPAAVWFET
jgi:hypothetical protein